MLAVPAQENFKGFPSPSALAIRSGTAEEGSARQHLAMVERFPHNGIPPR
jgi:hypothetical protein